MDALGDTNMPPGAGSAGRFQCGKPFFSDGLIRQCCHRSQDSWDPWDWILPHPYRHNLKSSSSLVPVAILDISSVPLIFHFDNHQRLIFGCYINHAAIGAGLRYRMVLLAKCMIFSVISNQIQYVNPSQRAPAALCCPQPILSVYRQGRSADRQHKKIESFRSAFWNQLLCSYHGRKNDSRSFGLQIGMTVQYIKDLQGICITGGQGFLAINMLSCL